MTSLITFYAPFNNCADPTVTFEMQHGMNISAIKMMAVFIFMTFIFQCALNANSKPSGMELAWKNLTGLS